MLLKRPREKRASSPFTELFTLEATGQNSSVRSLRKSGDREQVLFIKQDPCQVGEKGRKREKGEKKRMVRVTCFLLALLDMRRETAVQNESSNGCS